MPDGLFLELIAYKMTWLIKKSYFIEIFLSCFYLVIIIVIEKLIWDKHVETIRARYWVIDHKRCMLRSSMIRMILVRWYSMYRTWSTAYGQRGSPPWIVELSNPKPVQVYICVEDIELFGVVHELPLYMICIRLICPSPFDWVDFLLNTHHRPIKWFITYRWVISFSSLTINYWRLSYV